MRGQYSSCTDLSQGRQCLLQILQLTFQLPNSFIMHPQGTGLGNQTVTTVSLTDQPTVCFLA